MSKLLSRDPLVALIRQSIRTRIDNGEFALGHNLPPERQFAELLGVSRGALREAIRLLESEGLVRIKHGVGVQVTNNPGKPMMTTIERLLPEEIKRLRQSAEARLIIEPELAALAAQHATAREGQQLLKEARLLAKAQDIDSAIEADLSFHHAIAKASRNQILQLLLQSLAEMGKRSRTLTLGRFGFDKAAEHHEAIAQAVIQKNPAAARVAMRSHIERAVSDLTPPAQP